MRIYISQPMFGKSDMEIYEERNRIIEYAKDKFKDVQIIDSMLDITYKDTPSVQKVYDPREDTNKMVKLDILGERIGGLYLSKSLQIMMYSDMVIFAPGWDKARGCNIEHAVCKAYGIPYLCLTSKDINVIQYV